MMSLARNKNIEITTIENPANKIIFSSSETTNSFVSAYDVCIVPNIIKKITIILNSFIVFFLC